MIKPIQAVFFDLDGTLVDTLDDIVRCVNLSLTSLGEPARSRDAIQAAVGDGVERLCARLLCDPGPERVAKMAARIESIYRESLEEQAAPYSGVREMVSDLRALALRMAVLSNKPHDHAVRLMERLFGPDCFDAVLGQTAGLPGKPDPAGAFQTADRLRVPRSSVLLVGDTEVDIGTGKNAGMPTVGVTWGFRTQPVLEEAGADWIAHTPKDVVRVVQSFL